MAEQQFDIVIVGGGITGLTLAALLADTDFSIAIVERFPLPELAEDPQLRVSAISRASMQVFADCGIRRQLLADRATAFEQMHVWDTTGAGEIHFDSAETGNETLGYIIENNRLQAVLAARVAKAANIRVYRPVDIDSITLEQPAVIRLADGETLNARLLVGADGINSAVRATAGIELKKSPYDQQGLVCTVATELGHQHTAWQIFLPTGPLAFLPMFNRAGKSLCSIVWSLPTQRADEMLVLAQPDFEQALQQAFEHRLGKLELQSQRAAFPLNHGHVDQYVQDGLALIGDAAHVIHPLAGQGANLGILDAAALAGVLSTTSAAGRDWSARHSLRAYERSRKGENRLMETAMSGFNGLFTNDSPWLSIMRNAGLNLVDHAPLVKHRFMRHAMGI